MTHKPGFKIAHDFSLPIDAVTQAGAILARRGAGKTHTASVLVEEVVGAGLPVVVLDPTGAWWGLRASADGKKAGLPVVILGGEHGDVPLAETAGKVIADVVVDHPGAYVIDLSAFESKAAEHRFSADFLDRLYRAKAKKRDSLLLVVDEADFFAPQRPGPDQMKTLGALESIARRGRIRGLAPLLISQRSAVLNKNVLSQIEILIALQTTDPRDRAAIEEWVGGNGTKEERAEVLGSLASLPIGEAWVWSPSWLRILKRVKIRARHTFDSSKTPAAGQRRIEPKKFAAVDLERLGEQIRATAEQVKNNDPKALQRRIGELEGLLHQKAKTEKPIVQTVERAKRLAIPKELGVLVKRVDAIGHELENIYGKMQIHIEAIKIEDDPRGKAAPVASPPVERYSVPPRPRAEKPGAVVAGDPNLGGGERKILIAAAQHVFKGITREQATILTGYKRSTRDAYLYRLQQKGLIEADGESFHATDAGLTALGTSYELLPTGTALIEYWLAHLPKGERDVFKVVVDAYPYSVTREAISEATGYKRSTRDAYAYRLATRKLVASVGRSEIKASEEFFQ